MLQRFILVSVTIAGFMYAKQCPAQVVINEIQPSNTNTIADENGEYPDWIELYNSGNNPADLSGYGLSDNANQPFLFRFENTTIPSHGFLTVFASDENKSDINTHWETAVRDNDSWKYRVNTSTPPDTNWRNNNFQDVSWNSGTGGIGYGDGDDGTTVPACISVYMRKTFTIPDTSQVLEAIFQMDYDDGFVAYLNGVEIARINVGTRGIRPAWNLAAASLHEAVMYQGQRPDSFMLDYQALHAILRNGDNVLAVETHNQTPSNVDLTSRPFLSFSVRDGNSYFGTIPSWFYAPVSYLHAEFKLGRNGETVYLSDPQGNISDSYTYGALESDNSTGRNPDGSSTWCLYDVPTPGVSNGNIPCAGGYTTIPVFSLAGGYYTGSQTLSLSTTFPNGEIRFTLDGSDVSQSSSLYSSPILLDSNRTVRARVFAAGYLPGQTITNTFFINFTSRLPVFSITTDPDNLWDYYTGIFVEGPNAQSGNPHWGANYWQDWEKPVTVEFYDRSDTRAFRFNSGMKVTGGWSRAAGQKSLEIMLGDKYGLSDLNYPLVPSVKPWLTKWDDFVLHDAGNDRNLCNMRDPVMERLLKGTHNDFLAYEPCLLFINGSKWGVYYIRENDDHHWIESNYGYKKDEIDLLKESYFYPTMEVKKGDDLAFWNMYNFATTTSANATGFYDTMDSLMDLKNMADYFIAETYYPNDDWMGGGNNNLKIWRPRKPGGKFRYLIYDLDFGLGYSGSPNKNMLATARNPNPHNYNSDIFDALTQNDRFRQYFINRYADLINTIFLPSSVTAMIDLFRDSLKYDMHNQFEIWGNDSAGWISNINNMINFASQRPAYARNIVQSEFGLNGQVTLTLNVQPAGAGRIEISTLVPQAYPWSGVYFNGNPVTITAIPNPGYSFDHWQSNIAFPTPDTDQSVSHNYTSTDQITCYFSGSPQPATVTFSEINYNSDTVADAGDWIELWNYGNAPLDLSGWKFRDEADNHTFEFPVSTVLPANGYLVLASDLGKFRAVHPSVQNVTGDFGFDFSNGGEILRLFNSRDSLFLSVEYSDQQPWPINADGQGYTLELADHNQSLDQGSNWFAGCLYGSPGTGYNVPSVQLLTTGMFQGCMGDTIVLSGSGSATATFQWLSGSLPVQGAISPDLDVTATGWYQLSVTENGCTAVSDSVGVVLQTMSIMDSTVSAYRCDSGTVVLRAYSQDTIRWYDAPSGGQLLYTGPVFTTPVLFQSTDYYAIAGSACPSVPGLVNASVLQLASPPAATDSMRCGAGQVMLHASDTATVRWYDAVSGGSLLWTGQDFLTPNLNQSEIYYAEAGDWCPGARVPVAAIILPVPADPVVPDVGSCGPSALTFTTNSPDSVSWYDFPGGNLLATGNTFTTPYISQSTVYYVQAGVECMSGLQPVHAVIHSLPQPFLGNDTILTSGSSRLLDAGAGYITYFWSSGQQTQTITALTGGIYTVTVVDTNGCTGSDEIEITFQTAAGELHEFNAEVYPNPAVSYCLIRSLSSGGNSRVQLLDTGGRMLMENNLPENGTVRMNLEKISAGMYFIRIINEKKSETFRLEVK
ncbi:MAG: lamin tail domain-containing protein [Bacteroidia bacterium]|nr:lamin tail domain-containing protein [Bacteroidia bacterium]